MLFIGDLTVLWIKLILILGVNYSSILLSHLVISVVVHILIVALVNFRMKSMGMTTYMYAPKHDAKHRAFWRDLYSVEEAGKS